MNNIHAKWITGNYKPHKNKRYPVDCFSRDFIIAKTLKSAIFKITSCGLYEAAINDKRIGNFVLAPGSSDYRKRLYYQTYDVTMLMQQGANTLNILLADGWFRGSVGCYGKTNVYGRETKLLCCLEIVYADGSTEIIASDETFRWSNEGAIRFADLKDGEVYDARRKSPRITPGINASIARITDYNVISEPQINVPITEHEVFSTNIIRANSCNSWILDFSQNIAGFISFTLQGKPGQHIKIRLGEMLDANGEFTQTNFQAKKPTKEWGPLKDLILTIGMGDKLKHTQPTPKQQIDFICSGGIDTYKTRFAIFGFRYALVESDDELDIDSFIQSCKAIAVYSDMKQTGTFTCSNEKINKLVQNTLWSMKGNFADVPTDCPTRERLGWTGDAQIFFNTASYFMDVSKFFYKYMVDMEDGKMKNGIVPAVVPWSAMDMMYNNTAASVGWGDAAVYLPYRYWKRYNDRDALQRFYQSLSKPYGLYAIAHTGMVNKKEAKNNPYNKYTYEKGHHLGEWLEPVEFRDNAFGNIKQTEVATAYLFYAMKHLEMMAQELDLNDDAQLWHEYKEGAKKAYFYLFMANGAPDTDRQAKLVRPLALGIIDGDDDAELKAAIQKRLIQAVKNRNCRIGTGFLSTPFILSVLSYAGETELAYKMLENEDTPSWLAEVKAGATTIWENWEGDLSQNHYSHGVVCQWLFDTVAGIRVDGENHFIIEPIPGGTLTYAQASYQSPYGKVESRWEKLKDIYEFSITIPANTTAEVRLIDGSRKKLDAGLHHFKLETDLGDKRNDI
jgi:alpha-L-rhamnosidase